MRRVQRGGEHGFGRHAELVLGNWLSGERKGYSCHGVVGSRRGRRYGDRFSRGQTGDTDCPRRGHNSNLVGRGRGHSCAGDRGRRIRVLVYVVVGGLVLLELPLVPVAPAAHPAHEGLLSSVNTDMGDVSLTSQKPFHACVALVR